MGSMLNNDMGYACKFADFLTQSFHPVKTITTGEGGMVVTDDKKIAEACYRLKNHGRINKGVFIQNIKTFRFVLS